MDPFKEVRVGAGPLGGTYIAFWVGRESRGDELVLRAFDMETRLQWGIVKTKIEGLSEVSASTLIKDALNRLLSQLPFQGVMLRGKVTLWSSADSFSAAVVERTGIDRHPFLPQVLKFRYKVVPDVRIAVSRRPDGGKSLLGEGKKLNSVVAGEKPLWMIIQSR